MPDFESAGKNNGGYHSPHGERRDGGCFVSAAMGFVLLLLAILIAVGVGIIVHFAGPRSVVCKCGTTENHLAEQRLREQCMKIIRTGDTQICKACPRSDDTMTSSSSSQVLPTTAPTSATSSLSTTPPSTPAPPINYRLPTTLKPIHYNIEIKPDIYGTEPNNFTFDGLVDIQIQVLEATDNITLHIKDIEINRSSISIDSLNVAANNPRVENVSTDDVRDFFVIHLTSLLEKDRKYQVTMGFSGKMRRDLFGLYTSSYKDNNETVYMAVTQFAATHARKAFPCFDEPALKATFNITLLRKTESGRNYTTLSNTELVYVEDRQNGYVADVYKTTPVMSTYLVAFIVCDYLHMEKTTNSGIKVRVWARPNAIQYSEFALSRALSIFGWFNDHFKPSYPVSKLDNVAVPTFNFGAMENWGAITYRETILYYPGLSTASDDDYITRLMTHEIAHMWFGNTVVHKWWWWVWLKEGFASFWQARAVDKIYPKRREVDQFVVRTMHTMLNTDGVQFSHPMTSDVESPTEIHSGYNSITYSKAACIVRMMEFIMGEKLFMDGLNLYLQRFQGKDADAQDLFDALSDEADNQNKTINMTDIMDPWVTQMNYPVIHVTRTGNGVFRVSQRRFLNRPGQNETNDVAPYGYMWEVPITFASNLHPSFDKQYNYEDIKWLKKRQREADIIDDNIPNPSDADSWVIVNIQQYGFYRVNYNEENWMALIKQLETNFTIIHRINRAQIINDAWAMAEAGLLNTSIALRTLEFIKEDFDYVPWRAFRRHIYTLDDRLEHSDIYGGYRNFIRTVVEKVYTAFGWDIIPDPPIKAFTTNGYITAACTFGIEDCEETALRLFRQWMGNSSHNPIDVNIRKIVYCTAIRKGGWSEWQFAYNQYKTESRSTAKSDLLEALSFTTEHWLLRKLLSMSVNPDDLPSSTTLSVVNNVAKNPSGRDLAWNFFKESYDKLSKKNEILSDVTASFDTEFYIKEIEDFVKNNNCTGSEKAFDAALSKTKQNIDWLGRNYETVKGWLLERGYMAKQV